MEGPNAENTERCVKLAGSAGPLCRVWELNRGARNRNICKILSHSALITQQVINMNREALSFFPLENFSYSQYALLFEPVHPPQCIANGAERLQKMAALWAGHSVVLVCWHGERKGFPFCGDLFFFSPIVTHLTLEFLSLSSESFFRVLHMSTHKHLSEMLLNSELIFLSFTSHMNTKVSIEVTSRHSKQNLIFPRHKEHEF